MSFFVGLLKPLAYVSVPVFVLKSVAAASPTGRYYIRIGMYLGTLTFIATWGAAIAAVVSAVGRRYDVNIIIARSFYALASNVMDIEVEVEGAEHLASTRPAILMANHQSFLDILIVGKLIPRRTSIMAKSSIRFTPLGPFMILSGAIFVDRGNNARAVRSIKAAGETMKNKSVSLWMFPEGTRYLSEAPDLLPFKKGGFHLAVQAGIPVLPIVTENYHWLYRKGFFGTGVIKVKVLPPIETKDMKPEDTNDLALRVRSQMLEALRDMAAKTPPAQQGAPPPAPPEKAVVESAVRVDPQTPAIIDDIPAMSKEGTPGPGSSVSEGRTREASENGADTEEDEGMVLVGHPA